MLSIPLHTISTPKTLRKNFTMSNDTARELDFLATLLHKNQSQIIPELIQRESLARRNELRIAKLQQLKGAFTGLISDKQSIQRMKSERVR